MDPTVSLSAELLYGNATLLFLILTVEGRFPSVDTLNSGMDIRQMDLHGEAA